MAMAAVQAKAGNVCTLPSCKAEKTRLQWGRDAAEAASKGMKTMEPEEAAKIFNPSYNGGPASLVHGAKFVDLEAKPDLSLLGHANANKVKPWQALLKDAPTPVEVILAQDPSGRTRKLVNREAAADGGEREVCSEREGDAAGCRCGEACGRG